MSDTPGSESSTLLILAFIVGLVFVGIAAAGQFAFNYLNAARLRHLMQQGASRSQAVAEVLNRPGPFLSSIALLYLLSVAATTLAAFELATQLISDIAWRIVWLSGATLCALSAQIVARSVAALNPERTAVLLYTPLRIIGVITLPIVRPWYALTEMVLRRMGGRTEDRLPTTEEDLRVLVDAVEETEALEEDERDMIASIFEMSDRDVSEIMVPRIDMVAMAAEQTVAEGMDLLIRTGHSRVPVYSEDLDHLRGMIHLRDLARELRAGREHVEVGSLVRAVHIVPETKKIDELLHEFQAQRVQMAIVADEYGGTAGIVTIEDLLEEIVGEIHDEYDIEDERIQIISATVADMDARLNIHDVNEVFPLNLSDDDYDTLGGLVYEKLSKVPTVGDIVQLEHATIQVLTTKGRRVQRVRVTFEASGTTGVGNGTANQGGSASQ